MIRLAAALVAIMAASPPAIAQTPPPAAPAPVTAATRFINADVFASPAPAGLTEYADALRTLDTAMRPVANELAVLRNKATALQKRKREAGSQGSAATARTAEELRQALAQVQAKQEQAQRELTMRQRAIVGPVEDRILASAERYARARAIPDLRFTATGALEPLRRGGAQEVTADFIAWFKAEPKR